MSFQSNPVGESINSQYREHIGRLQTTYEAWFEQHEYTAIVVDSGLAANYYRDDIQIPYRGSAHFMHWLPLSEAAGSVLVVRKGKPPVLLLQRELGFWHQQFDESSCFGIGEFVCEAQDAVNPVTLIDVNSAVYLGPDAGRATAWGISQVNPPSLVAHLDWNRAYKTPYEQTCMGAAAKIAIKGHQAVAEGFREGLSEWQLHLRYLGATEQSEQQLPYPNIIALNQHGSVLHYQQRNRQIPVKNLSLLIDAGAGFNGYAADISRTYAANSGAFSDLIALVEQQQQKLIRQLAVGRSYLDVHVDACLAMAEVLQTSGLVDAEPKEQLSSGLVQCFFPHGIGHLLGLNTHDAGGWQENQNGGENRPPPDHPYLRLTRQIDTDMVFTIEPGIYFIESLLEKLKQHKLSRQVDWALVDALKPYGGVRIEDNVLMQSNGSVQLSR